MIKKILKNMIKEPNKGITENIVGQSEFVSKEENFDTNRLKYHKWKW
jgi:hypothetical protein